MNLAQTINIANLHGNNRIEAKPPTELSAGSFVTVNVLGVPMDARVASVEWNREWLWVEFVNCETGQSFEVRYRMSEVRERVGR